MLLTNKTGPKLTYLWINENRLKLRSRKALGYGYSSWKASFCVCLKRRAVPLCLPRAAACEQRCGRAQHVWEKGRAHQLVACSCNPEKRMEHTKKRIPYPPALARLRKFPPPSCAPGSGTRNADPALIYPCDFFPHSDNACAGKKLRLW